VGGKFKLEKELTTCVKGDKVFGPQIYRGKNLLTGKPVAIKIQKVTRRVRMYDLKNEALVYKKLRKNSTPPRLTPEFCPKLYWYGRQGPYNVIVTEYMGANLSQLQENFFNNTGCRFSLESVYKIAF
jgi:serine/threonine protein kinase